MGMLGYTAEQFTKRAEQFAHKNDDRIPTSDDKFKFFIYKESKKYFRLWVGFVIDSIEM